MTGYYRISLCLLVLLTAGFLAARQSRDVDHGAIVRGDRESRRIALVFTGHEFANSGETIRGVLHRRGIPASFFFTGDFYRNTVLSPLIRGLAADHHYLGAHSDKHLLYCSWERRDSLLVTKKEFLDDLAANYVEMTRFGIGKEAASVFLPPYEWLNDSIAAWTAEFGLTLVNFTPGTSSNADYTFPEPGRSYLPNDSIYSRILRKERADPHGLNGFLLLLHVGADPRRPELFSLRLDELAGYLLQRGYEFVRVDSLVRSGGERVTRDTVREPAQRP